MERPLYEQRRDELERAVATTHGSLSISLRKSLMDRARCHAKGEPPRPDGSWMSKLADEVARNPASADVDGCLRAGKTEDEIFEVVVAASVGVALARAAEGLAALEDES
jgi:hypothetical protein